MKRVSQLTIDLIALPGIALVGITLAVLNNLSSQSWYPLILFAAGISTYLGYLYLGRFFPALVCDYVPSGEGAAASLAVFAALSFAVNGWHLIALWASMAVFICQIFILSALRPHPFEQAVWGIGIHALCAAVAFLIATGSTSPEIYAEAALLGIMHAIPPSLSFSLSAFAAGIAAIVAGRLLDPTLRLHALGTSYSPETAIIRTAIDAALTALRSILLAMAIMAAGWLLSIGRAVVARYPGRLRFVAVALAVFAVSQGIVSIGRMYGPALAIAATCFIAYASFAVQHLGRNSRHG